MSDGQLFFDGFGEALADGGHGDLGDDLVEETAHHQAAGLLFGDAAGAQVEQLLVVESSGGTGVSGTGDLAGLDFEVGHRIGTRTVGEHQVAVDFEGVGAGGLGADQDVTDPHRVRVGLARLRISLQRTLVQHIGLAVGIRMIDQQAGLEELPVVGEVGAQQFRVTTGSGEAHGGRGADHIATEGDGDMAQRGVLAELGVVRADVDGVIGPVGDPDDPERGRITDDQFDVVRVDTAAAQVDDDGGASEFLDADLQVPVGHGVHAGAVDADLDGLGHLGGPGDRHDGRLAERRVRLCGNAVGGHTARAEALVVTRDGLDRHTRTRADLDRRRTGRRGRAVVQAAQPLEWGETPHLVAPGGHLEGVDIERGELLALVEVEHRAALGRALHCLGDT